MHIYFQTGDSWVKIRYGIYVESVSYVSGYSVDTFINETVLHIGCNSNYGYGSNYDYVSIYAHIYCYLVKSGDYIDEEIQTCQESFQNR